MEPAFHPQDSILPHNTAETRQSSTSLCRPHFPRPVVAPTFRPITHPMPQFLTQSNTNFPPMSSSSPGGSHRTRSVGTSNETNLLKTIMNRYFTKRKAKKAPQVPKFEVDLTTALPTNDDFRTSLIMNSLSARFSMLKEQYDPNSMIGKASDDSVLHPKRQSRLHEFGFTPGRAGLADIAEVSSIKSSIRPPFASEQRSNSFASEGGYPTDDDASQSGSIMSRSKPGEGNILFGGRQKIYKVPLAGAAFEANLGENGLKGRALYDDDVSMSTFQKFRREERERLAREQLENGPDGQEDSGKTSEEFSSPSKAPSIFTSGQSNITRQTSTSTSTSMPSGGRTSTAATSIASQGPGSVPSTASAHVTTFAQASAAATTAGASAAPSAERTATKSRRLYENGLDREIQEQQSSAMSKFNSVQNQLGRASPTPYSKPTVVSDRPPALAQVPLRSATPTRTSPPPIVARLAGQSSLSGKSTPEKSPPASPVMSNYGHNPLMAALSPRDRGKATAMGAFNKPQKFNEQQYLERQMTLRRERDAASRKEAAKFGPAASPMSSSSGERTPSQVSNDSQATSKEDSNAPSAFSVFQRAAKQMKAADEPKKPAQEYGHSYYFERSSSESERTPPMPVQPPSTVHTPLQSRTPSAADTRAPQFEHPVFRFQNSNHTESTRSEQSVVPEAGAMSYDEQERLATQGSIGSQEAEDSKLGVTNGGLSGMIRQHLRNISTQSSIYPQSVYGSVTNTPQRAPPSNLELRTHDFGPSSRHQSDLDTPGPSNVSNVSNPFDLEDIKGPYDVAVENDSPVSPLEEPEAKLPAPTSNGLSSPHQPVRQREPMDSRWQDTKSTHARGDSSATVHEQDALQSELARRQQAIQERLRARMQAEQNGNYPQPASQLREKPSGGPFRGLEMLRTKSSRESMKGRAETPNGSKAAKLLGLGGSPPEHQNQRPPLSPMGLPSHPAAAKPSFQPDRFQGERFQPDRFQADRFRPGADQTYSSSSSRSRSNSRPPTALSNHQRSGYSSANESARQSHEIANGRPSEETTKPARNRGNSNAPSMRSRSNSELSAGRSRSRTGQYRDDLEKAMVEGTSSRMTMVQESSPTLADQFQNTPPMPSIGPSHQQQSPEYAQTGRLRIHTSRPPPKHLLDREAHANGLYPPQPIHSPMSPAGSARSSPSLPIHGNTILSPIISPRPSPGIPPSPNPMGFGPPSARASPIPYNNFAAATPPLSGASTPIAPNFPGANPNANPAIPPPLSSSTSAPSTYTRAQSASRDPSGGSGPPRKRSIQKHEIGEPRLISTTSVIDTVSLEMAKSNFAANPFDSPMLSDHPVFASGYGTNGALQGGLPPPPPVPPINPMRRRGVPAGAAGARTPDLDMHPALARERFAGLGMRQSNASVGHLGGYGGLDVDGYPPAGRSVSGPGFKPGHKLRKSSSEGGEIGLRLRSQMHGVAPPGTPGRVMPMAKVEGGMF